MGANIKYRYEVHSHSNLCDLLCRHCYDTRYRLFITSSGYIMCRMCIIEKERTNAAFAIGAEAMNEV